MEVATEKMDLLKADPNYYKAGLKPEVRDLDSYFYVSIEGQSAPEDEQFNQAMEALYSVCYGIKFLCKAEDSDFVVPKMEAYWWAEGANSQEEFEQAPRSEWCWQIMIRMPDFVEATHFFRAMESARSKKPNLENLEQLKFELIKEGRSAQILHIGSYEEEKPTISKLHDYITESGLSIKGRHKEIYLSDPRKTAPEKLRTIIRYGVK